jgi:hypothetical protein
VAGAVGAAVESPQASSTIASSNPAIARTDNVSHLFETFVYKVDKLLLLTNFLASYNIIPFRELKRNLNRSNFLTKKIT